MIPALSLNLSKLHDISGKLTFLAADNRQNGKYHLWTQAKNDSNTTTGI